jgi:hypothetical protein
MRAFGHLSDQTLLQTLTISTFQEVRGRGHTFILTMFTNPPGKLRLVFLFTFCLFSLKKMFFSCNARLTVLYFSTLRHLPPLRSESDEGCWD